MHTSFVHLVASGGSPPYRWSLTDGPLPDGLNLSREGILSGTIATDAERRDYALRFRVRDAAGGTAESDFTLTVQERPNRWYEQTRLVALIHRPECLRNSDLPEFARLMKRQGYGVGMVISYNNGDYLYRWPSRFDPSNKVGDVVGRYKAALLAEGIRFGMYLGNLDGANCGGETGTVLLLDEVMRRYQPDAIWFDWAGWEGISLDAIYSVIRAHNPNTVIILNGVPTLYNGDWDTLVLEGWGAWGEWLWDLMPFRIDWPKCSAMETWRLVADPAFECSKGVQPDWMEYLRLQISIIGMGCIANIDHSPTLTTGLGTDGKLTSMKASIILQCHQAMAAWANPPGIPPLHESYTQVDAGPIRTASWGYSTINSRYDTIYLHFLRNPQGKTGLPAAKELTVGPVPANVRQATWMNRNRTMPFRQQGEEVTLVLNGVEQDLVDTIVRLELDRPVKYFPADRTAWNINETNIALYKPSRLLSRDGLRSLPSSGMHLAYYGNDGGKITSAQGGNEWAWTYEVDLVVVEALDRIVVCFGKGYPTDYEVTISTDRRQWTRIVQGSGAPSGRFEHTCSGREARYIRIQANKPDGPDQTGAQMSIAELEAYSLPQ